MNTELSLHAVADRPLTGETSVPGDKSISHRAVILGSLAQGETRVTNLLEGEDVLCTVAAFRAMGIQVERSPTGEYRIHGRGLDGLSEPKDVLNLGNSGTSMRLLTGLLASQPFFSVLTGDASLRSRPMGRVIHPLSRMGARIHGRGQGRFAPLAIQGGELIPMAHHSPVASAQVKSALLLAGINAAGATSVTEPALSRDHTERMLAAFGARVTRDGLQVTVEGWPDLVGQEIAVPGDISSAAFPLAAALLIPGSHLTLTGVGVNPTRTGILDLVAAMGGRVTQTNPRLVGGEPVADLEVCYSELRGITVDPDLVPRAIDEFPIFFVLAALASGETVVRGAAELRVKESDRIAMMAANLQRLGAAVTEFPDGLRIVGQPQGLTGGVTLDSGTDHRVAMSLLVAGLTCHLPVTVTRCDAIQTSFPGFVALMQSLGGHIFPSVAA